MTESVKGAERLKTPFIPLPVRVTKSPLQPFQTRLIQRGNHGRSKSHIRLMDAGQYDGYPTEPKVIVEWPSDFTSRERSSLRYGEIVYRGSVRYYEADL